MEDVQVLGVSKSNDGKQAQYWATDPKAGYTLLQKQKPLPSPVGAA